MKGTLNKVILIGNVGKDPVSKTVGDNIVITNISIATIKVKGSKSKGNVEEVTDWHNVVLFGFPATFCRDYVKKGDKVCIEGSLSNSQWMDNNTGTMKYKTEIMAENIQVMKSKGASNGYGEEKEETQKEGKAEFEDDIPF